MLKRAFDSIATTAAATFLFLSLAMESNATTPITAVEYVSGLADPVLAVGAPGDLQRLFIVEQTGRIQIAKNGVLNGDPFLDVSSKIVAGGERGLLGLAFDPNYPVNGRFYVNYTRTGDGATVVERYVRSANPDLADASSGEQIIVIGQPFGNHNGGMIEIGPADGYLYIGTGDGGSGGDPDNRAQDPSDLLGKMLRIDVSGTGTGYVIPVDNPFVGTVDTLPEIWALGLRNPWRFSFDRANGDMYIADVGQGDIEEIDFQDASSSGGENYGWRLMEGDQCYNPATNCDPGDVLDDPIHVYSHGGSPFRCSVSGGYVYRGCAVSDLSGVYFFADFCSGQVWSLKYTGSSVIEFQERTSELGLPSISVSGFGQDTQGELYIMDYNGGKVFKIEPDGVPSACGNCCDEPGDFNNDGSVDVTDLTDTVDYMFAGGFPAVCQSEADLNASCEIDIADLTYRVDFMFVGGPAPVCGCID